MEKNGRPHVKMSCMWTIDFIQLQSLLVWKTNINYVCSIQQKLLAEHFTFPDPQNALLISGFYNVQKQWSSSPFKMHTTWNTSPDQTFFPALELDRQIPRSSEFFKLRFRGPKMVKKNGRGGGFQEKRNLRRISHFLASSIIHEIWKNFFFSTALFSSSPGVPDQTFSNLRTPQSHAQRIVWSRETTIHWFSSSSIFKWTVGPSVGECISSKK